LRLHADVQWSAGVVIEGATLLRTAASECDRTEQPK
jgi:hypothetical protein